MIGSYNKVEPIAPAMVERLVRVRMQRQQILLRDPGVQLSVVLDESVLIRRIGSDQVMYEQLQRLARDAERANVTLRIRPLDAEHDVFTESFVIFGFGPENGAVLRDVVSSEHLKSAFSVDGERDTYLHRIVFDKLGAASLDPDASKQLILDTAESCWAKDAYRR